MRQFKLVTIAALVLAMALFTVPSSSQAAVGQDPGTGVDLNGVTYYRVWVTGADLLDPNNWELTFQNPGDRWFEWYTAADGNTWQSWTGINAFVDADTFVTNGDYWMAADLSDGAGAVSNYYEYDVGGTFEMSRSLANGSVGYLDSFFQHEDPLTFAGAYFEEIEKYNEPSGTFIDNMRKWTDLDGDGDYDLAFESWNEFEAGTGDKDFGFSEINWAANTFNSQSREDNTITGDYRYYDKAALDAGDNAVPLTNPRTQDTRQYATGGGNFPSGFSNSGVNGDYFFYSRNQYYADYQESSVEKVTQDYPGIYTGGFASYSRDYQYNYLASGAFNQILDQRIDTDDDGSFNDWAWAGSNPGAYREYSENELEIGDGQYTSTRFRKWDAVNGQYTDNQSIAYTSGFSESSTQFQWDFGKDGFNENEDYSLYTSSRFNDNGVNYQDIRLKDFVSDDLGTGVANSLSWEREETIATGHFYENRDERVDNDNDGDLNDYEDKGALAMFSSSGFDFNDGYSYSGMETWDPGGDFDPVSGTFGTKTSFESWSYIGGDSGSSSEFAKDTDNDGEIEDEVGDDLYIESSTNFEADSLYSEAESHLWEDDNNNRGAYQELYTYSESYAPSGEFFNEAYAVNLAGRVSNESGFYADEGYSWTESETRTWGVNLVRFSNESYLGGDSLVESQLFNDTDGDTDFQNQFDYEQFITQFNEVEGSWNYVGYNIRDDNTGAETTQVQGFSAAYDFLAIDEELAGGQGTREQLYGYTSGDLAGGMLAKFGTLELWGQIAADTTGLNVSYAKYKWAPGLSANPLDWYYLYDYEI